MAIAVEMPKMSDTMEEGRLVSWLIEEGSKVVAGDIVAQVETDKATMDLEVYDDGVLLKRVVQEGESIPIGGLIAVLGKAGEDVSSLLSKYQGGDGAVTAPEAQAPSESTASESTTPTISMESGEDDSRIKASPLARKIAADQGIALSHIQGSGPEGRIIKRDVAGITTPTVASQPKQPATPVPAASSVKDVSLTMMRKTIARRLASSKFTAPHFYLQVDVDMENTIAFRGQLNALAEEQGLGKISFNDIITKVCAVALKQHPQVNASYLEAEGIIRYYDYVNVAVAVAIDEGLVTPVIRNTDTKGLTQIASETKELALGAKNRTLQPEAWEGSTFTTSNLGMFGIERFTAIINPPNACILAIGAIRDVPVVKDGQVVPGKRMSLSLSCDHRVVDGAIGSQFLTYVKQLLENPMGLML